MMVLIKLPGSMWLFAWQQKAESQWRHAKLKKYRDRIILFSPNGLTGMVLSGFILLRL